MDYWLSTSAGRFRGVHIFPSTLAVQFIPWQCSCNQHGSYGFSNILWWQCIMADHARSWMEQCMLRCIQSVPLASNGRIRRVYIPRLASFTFLSHSGIPEVQEMGLLQHHRVEEAPLGVCIRICKMSNTPYLLFVTIIYWSTNEYIHLILQKLFICMEFSLRGWEAGGWEMHNVASCPQQGNRY